MTKQELSQLDADIQQEYIEDGIERMQKITEELKDTIDLPYPENLIKYAFGKRSVILQPTETFWNDYVEQRISSLSPDSAVEMRSTLDIIFKQRGSIEELVEVVDLIPYSAAYLPCGLARILRNWSSRRHLRDYIEIIPNKEDTLDD